MIMSSSQAADLRAALDREGFVKIPHAFSKEEVESYRNACEKATHIARAGQWPYVRTLPKQFPPWPVGDVSTNGIWGVQHLLHPDMPGRETFAQSYFNETMINAVTSLLNCSPDDLVLELYNMLVRPDQDFALRWHRDDIGPDASAEEEVERLHEPMVHAQWNLPLFADSSLVVVPGSHKRARTDTERSADPYESHMPGQEVVKLDAGDILFYNNNILHRGVYDSRTERMTLHGTMGLQKSDPARARNILQHGIGTWVSRCDFGTLSDKHVASVATGMQRRLLELGDGQGIGFSQSDK